MLGSPGTVKPGGTINYTVTLGNTTGVDATSLSFNDFVDSHTTLGSIQSTPVTLDQNLTINEDPAPSPGITITLQGQDPDGDLPANAFSIVDNVTHGTLGTVSSATCVNGLCSATVTYLPTQDYNGSDKFTFQVNDGTSNANQKGTVNITINAVNDAPTINYGGSPASGTLSTLTINEDTAKVLNGANLFSVADVDAGAGLEKISLGVTHGKINLASVVGLTFVDGTANNTATVHFTGNSDEFERCAERHDLHAGSGF